MSDKPDSIASGRTAPLQPARVPNDTEPDDTEPNSLSSPVQQPNAALPLQHLRTGRPTLQPPATRLERIAPGQKPQWSFRESQPPHQHKPNHNGRADTIAYFTKEIQALVKEQKETNTKIRNLNTALNKKEQAIRSLTTQNTSMQHRLQATNQHCSELETLIETALTTQPQRRSKRKLSKQPRLDQCISQIATIENRLSHREHTLRAGLKKLRSRHPNHPATNS